MHLFAEMAPTSETVKPTIKIEDTTTQIAIEEETSDSTDTEGSSIPIYYCTV